MKTRIVRLLPSFPLVSFLFLFALGRPSWAAEAAASNPNTASLVEQFKDFIASPPTIERLVFESRVTPSNTNRNRKLSQASATNYYQGFIARWQPNARAIYQVFPQSVSTNPVMNWFSISVFGKKHWQIAPNGTLLFWFDDGTAPSKATEHNMTKTSVDHLTYRLAQVLNMGVYNVDIGSIRWQGDSFSVTNTSLHLKFDGMLHATGGLPTHVSLRLTTRTNSQELQLRYTFDRDIGVPYLPTQIRVMREEAGEIRELSRINIQSIRLANQEGGEDAFLPWTNLIAVPTHLRIYTNGAHYALGANGRLTRSPLSPPQAGYKPQYRGVFLGVCAAFSLAIFVLMVRAKVNHNHNRLPSEPRKETT